MHILTLGQLAAGLGHPGLQSRLRRLGRYQRVAARADQVVPARGQQGLADLEVIFRLEELKQRPLQLAVSQVARDVDFLTGERVEPGVVHTGGDVVAIRIKIRISGDRITRKRDASRGVR